MARRAASIGSSGSLRNSSSKISRIGMSPTAFASRSHNGWSGHGRERHVNQPAGEPGARDESGHRRAHAAKDLRPNEAAYTQMHVRRVHFNGNARARLTAAHNFERRSEAGNLPSW